jgi:small GTP-binding protein
MIQKKICMLGGYAVGKTSLVRRFVNGIFSEKYLTTVGVKIDKKVLRVGEREMSLILWDLHGEDDFQQVQMSYMRGASGYLLVVDGTRRESLDAARALQTRTEEALGAVPFILLLNKADLRDEWEFEDWKAEEFEGKDCAVLQTSAKTGLGVEEAFLILARKMLEE